MALDVARTAARGGEQANLQRNLSIVQALDVARSAIRFGAREVTVCCLESESEMPAAQDEIEEARREGIRFRHRRRPEAPRRRERDRDGSRVSCASRGSSTRAGRFSPAVHRGLGERSSHRHRHRRDRPDGRLLLSSTGGRDRGAGRPDRDRSRHARDHRAGRLRRRRRRIRAADRHQRRRRREARGAFHRRTLPRRPPRPSTRWKSRSIVAPRYERDLDLRGHSRARNRRPAPSRAASASPRSRNASASTQARREGARCLHCWTNTIFEENPEAGTECILCGGCQDICPEDCIEILPIAARARASGRRARARARARRMASAWDRSSSRTRRSASAAGSAPLRCPVGTITMQSFHTREDAVA